uniref:(northern house mosquito) hypothetical protein n=1 Tax=Culex pipiens TaxID=7175 RepID=A0A8D8FCV4_CULPI
MKFFWHFLFLRTTPRGIDLRTNQSNKKCCNLNLFLASAEFGILVPFVPTLSQINSNLFKKNSPDLVDPFVYFFVCSAPLMSFLLPSYFAHIHDLPGQIFVVVLGTMRAP